MAADDNINCSFNRKEKNNCSRLYHENLDKVYSSETTLNPKYCNILNEGHRSNKDIVQQPRCHQKLKSSSSGPEVRYINPAIYAESLNNEDDEEETTNIRMRVGRTNKTKILDNVGANKRFIEVNSGDTATRTANMLSCLSLKEGLVPSPNDYADDEIASPETYRCYFSTSTSSIDKSSAGHSESIFNIKPISHRRVERRCRIDDKTSSERQRSLTNVLVTDDRQKYQPEVRRYIINGHRVVHISTTSSIDSSKASQVVEESSPVRKSAHEEWLRKKRLYLQRKREEEEMLETKKREEEERLAREREEKGRRERENFFKWAERKKKEEEDKKAALEKEMEIEKQLKEFEEKALVAKALYLRQWTRKKEEEQKAQQRAQQLKEVQDEEERKRRQEISLKAYEEWRERSKNRPKPATQGLLPHQAAMPTFINPTPWQKLIDDDTDDGQGDGVKRTKVKRKIKNKKGEH
ncbi:inner centromere protein-like isoform X1 [Vespa mandarinia]|uniref:inner centromere protein-like isoform X1 n=1 Tax=Vespa mandarinia TaxID=7446 RepID=UPI00160EA954|nr:inner centromere protein-like isoform X1 [Vespa mandarinia]XP_035730206.1 inner centromere protein-like isoform X1 [Vespa mandarinia]